MTTPSALTLSASDLDEVAAIERLAREGAASLPALIARLTTTSWAVRRAVVAALAQLGPAAAAPLCDLLEHERSNEARVAAVVDALSIAAGDIDETVIALARRTKVAAVLCDAAQVLGRRKSGVAIDLLSELIKNEDDNVAVAAIEALGRIGGTTAIEPLVAAVQSQNFFRMFPAIEVLGASGDPRVIAPLARLLSQPTYARDAALALGRTGQVGAVAPLVQLLAREDTALFEDGVRALALLRDRYAARFVDTTPLSRSFREKVEPQAIDRILARSAVATNDDAGAYACVLGWIDSTRAVTALIALLARGGAVGVEASRALRAMGAVAEDEILAAVERSESATRLTLLPLVPKRQRSLPALLACLADEEPQVRAQASELLGRIGDSTVVPALFRWLGDPDARVSQTVVAAIQSLGSSEGRALAHTAARDGDERMRRAALRILSYFGHPDDLDALLAGTTDASARVRDTATQGLALIDDARARDALVTLSDDPSPQTRASAIRALGHSSLSEPSIVARIRTRLDDEDAWVRYYACQALARLGAREHIADIARLAQDSAGQVRVAAVEATARLGGPEAHVALERASESSDQDVRRAAITGLGLMRRADALPVLLRAIASPDSATRLITLSALASLDAPEVFDALVTAVGDRDENVVRAAKSLLAERADPRATRWLIARLSEDADREWALDALALPRARRRDEVLAALAEADAVHAPLLVNALTRMRRAEGDEGVLAALAFENVAARRAAACALVASPTPAAKEALARASKADPDDEVRKISAAAFS